MKVVQFPRWAEVLADAGLPEATRRGHKVTIRWYLSWCARRSTGCTVASAREFVDWAKEEKNANEWMVERWREAIRWFFINAKRQTVGADGGSSSAWQPEREKLNSVSAAYDAPDAPSRENNDEADKMRRQSVNDTEAERMEARNEDEQRILSTMRRKGMALNTERGYLRHYRDFVRQRKLRSASEITAEELKGYLDYLAMERAVSSSTQKGALNALIFVAEKAFGLKVGDIGDFVRAKNRKKIPTVMTRNETRALFDALEGEKRLMAQLQYAAGLRVSELLRLRVQDLDFERNQVHIRFGKGGKHRVAPLPEKLHGPLKTHLEQVRELFEEDLQRDDLAGVYLPEALARKHSNAGKDWRWQWVWPSREISKDPRSGVLRRHHVLDRVYQEAIRKAAKRAGLTKRVTSHALRHSFATHLLEDGVDIRTVQDLLGHKNVETTQIYLHVMRKPGAGVPSPLENL